MAYEFIATTRRLAVKNEQTGKYESVTVGINFQTAAPDLKDAITAGEPKVPTLQFMQQFIASSTAGMAAAIEQMERMGWSDRETILRQFSAQLAEELLKLQTASNRIVVQKDKNSWHGKQMG